ncbi:hypothetical protein DFH07DRAFT_796609 [Mycena maculata]|uniref:Uncharacterized protein n=1 Tax=Mycena maculata TaxID=230809 RepID=A0AAD7K6M1_9AGAR|nr:hypothetical protein DFH07DRAFT_796609 [Mycena maculata]
MLPNSERVFAVTSRRRGIPDSEVPKILQTSRSPRCNLPGSSSPDVPHADDAQVKILQTAPSPSQNVPGLDSPNVSQAENTQAPKISRTSNYLRWNLPVQDSPNASRMEEDITLCYVSPASEYDLTACASATSSLKIKGLPTASSLEFLLPQLPEIPDWYEDGQSKQDPEPTVEIPALNTPQSDYHSLADFHPASLCCEDVPAPEGATAQYSEVTTACHGSSILQPQARVSQHRRRTYSLDSSNQRPLELTSAAPPNAGSGYGLGLPFSPSPLSSVPMIPTDADLDRYPSPILSFTAHPNIHLNHWKSPPGLRRAEALAVWRPQGPVPTHTHVDGLDSDSDDVRSLEQPFPSTASIWVLTQHAPWPAERTEARDRPRARGPRGPREDTQKWSLEEQITIAVLAAMDSRDKRGRGACARSGAGGKKGKVRRLLGRIWR